MVRIREKSGDRCYQNAPILYRVQIDESKVWQFVCQSCWTIVQPDNPHYTYGGTWKARK